MLSKKEERKNLKKRYFRYIMSGALVLALGGCSSTSPNVSNPNVSSRENLASLEILNQRLLLPNDWSESQIKTKTLKADYESKEYTYARNTKNGAVETDNYETVNFGEFIYIKNMTFTYNECEPGKRRGIINPAFAISAPFILLGVTKGTDVNFPYYKLKIEDYASRVTMEIDESKIYTCDVNLKYQGFTNRLKIYFDTILGTGNNPQDALRKINVNNLYTVSYIDGQTILKIIQYNLKNRKDAALNESLVQEVAKLDDKKMFAALQQQKESFHLPKYSVLALPSDADFTFMSKNGYELYKNGFYKDKSGKTRAILDIIEEHLTQREDVELNEKLIEEILKLQDKSIITTLQQRKENYHLPKYSMLVLPQDSDFAFMTQNGQNLLKMGIYQDKNGVLKSFDTAFPNINYEVVTLSKPELPLDAQKSTLQQYYIFEDRLLPLAQSLEEIWNEMADIRAAQNLKNKEDERFNEVDQYAQIRKNLMQKYSEYKSASDSFQTKLRKELSKVGNYESDLSRYFAYKKHAEAKRRYKESMNENFGHYIEPSRWCLRDKCPDNSTIKNVITEEANKKWYDKSQGLAPNMTFMQFVQHEKIRSEIKHEIQNKVAKNGNTNIKPFYFERGFDTYREWSNDLILSNSYNEIDTHLQKLDAYAFVSLKDLLDAKSWRDLVLKPSVYARILQVCNNDTLARKVQKALLDKENNVKNLYHIYVGKI